MLQDGATGIEEEEEEEERRRRRARFIFGLTSLRNVFMFQK
jgi:hypothetical protein